MRRLPTIVVLLSFVASSAIAQVIPDHPLSLKETIELFRSRNQTLAAAQAHLDSFRGIELTAGLRPNPVFNSANEDFNVFNPSRFDLANAQEFTENISELVERGHKRQYRIASAALGTTVAKDTFNDQIRQLEFTLKTAFVSVLLAKSNLDLTQQNLRDYQETVRLNQIRLQAGDISQTDFDRLHLEQARFENDVLSAELNLKQAKVQLAALLGLTPTLDFDVQGDLAPPLQAFSLDELDTLALANRPDYLSARDGSRKAEADHQLAVANAASDVTVGSEYKRNGPDNTVGFTFSVPLRIFDRNQGEKLRSERELEASLQAEAAERTLVLADVAQAYESYQTALSRAQLYTQNYLQLARVVRDRTEFSFRNSGTTLLDYLDAIRNYRDVELTSRSAEANVQNALHQLSFVTGMELEK